MHSLLFSVEQVFLIHRETGLVLSHVVAPRVATQDPSLVSGMLSAIQQFVKDSFESQRGDNTLDFLEVGELEVWIEKALVPSSQPSFAVTRLKPTARHEGSARKYSAPLQFGARPFRRRRRPISPGRRGPEHLLETQFKNDRNRKKITAAPAPP